MERRRDTSNRSADTLSEGDSLGPEDWPVEAERVYARRQKTLADRHELDIDSYAVDTASAGRVHYLAAGDPDGEPVVLLHGINVPGATWLPMVPALADDYRVYIPDRPGVGLSVPHRYESARLRSFMTAYLVELFDHLALDRPHVIGSSLGGLQAFLLAIDHGCVDRLCLVGAAGGLGRDFDFLQRLMTLPGFNKLLYWMMYRGEGTPENIRERLGMFAVSDASAVSRAFCELLAAHRQLPGRIDSERSLARAETSFGRFLPMFDLRDDIVELESPTCFVWGTEDDFWPPEVGRAVADRMPDAQFHELPDHGHTPWLEPDERASDRVRTFLDER